MPTPYRQKDNIRQRRMPILPILLAMPLLFTLIFSLSNNRFIPAVASLAGMSLYVLSSYFLSRAHFYESQAIKHKWSRPNRTPWRFSAALFTAGATSLIAWLATDYDLFISLVYGVVAFLGMIFTYGMDSKSQDGSIGLVGVSSEELTEAFAHAEARIHSIRQAAKKVIAKDSALANRLEHIAQGSEKILDIINDDPKDLRRARKFLNVYLDGAQQVVNKYVNREHVQQNDVIESNLRKVLDKIDEVIEEQRIKLLEDDILELDVQIEVLQAQLKHEGIS